LPCRTGTRSRAGGGSTAPTWFSVRYHVSHVCGCRYETFPVNAYEAVARRIARFWDYGHTRGPMEVPPVEHNPSIPTPWTCVGVAVVESRETRPSALQTSNPWLPHSNVVAFSGRSNPRIGWPYSVVLVSIGHLAAGVTTSDGMFRVLGARLSANLGAGPRSAQKQFGRACIRLYHASRDFSRERSAIFTQPSRPPFPGLLPFPFHPDSIRRLPCSAVSNFCVFPVWVCRFVAWPRLRCCRVSLPVPVAAGKP